MGKSNKEKARKDNIQSLLTEVGESLPEATQVFVDLVVAAPEQRPELAQQLSAVESEADERYLALIHKVAQSFIPPFDREDIYEMVEALDDVVDQLEHAGLLLARFDLGELPDDLVATTHTLHQMAQKSQLLVGLIKKPKKLEALLIEINALENQMDQQYRDLLVHLLNDGDAVDVIKIKLLADCVEGAATKLDQFGRAVGLMAIKET